MDKLNYVLTSSIRHAKRNSKAMVMFKVPLASYNVVMEFEEVLTQLCGSMKIEKSIQKGNAYDIYMCYAVTWLPHCCFTEVHKDDTYVCVLQSQSASIWSKL